ncbi:MAG: hypothetical protein A3H98_05365 [Bacteroidetes bacterium RIFCSPLOWO2_02_FULL_36_8]|nr:MAG: hypothetical protein A3H98_05365 [Bacteroidetes bacterium RIFCSPLOWO2_02_FULL_36_8]OFY70306.1 MAG: hypothetical protein A3G23_09225 [Bacteroidetes bacterium RIFCSPLOWO2_12_FULL_37_12]
MQKQPNAVISQPTNHTPTFDFAVRNYLRITHSCHRFLLFTLFPFIFLSIVFLSSCNAPLNPSWTGKFLLTKGMAYNNFIWIYSKPEQVLEFAFNPQSGFLKSTAQPIIFLYKNDEVLLHLPDSLPSSGNVRSEIEYLNQKTLFDFQCYYDLTKKGKEIRLIGKAVEKRTADDISQFDFTVVFLLPVK